MRTEWSFTGWYYRQDGERRGPVSPSQLRALLASGQLPARKAVWKEDRQSLFFVPAVTAAFGEDAPADRPR
jgi:hypothetical protein